MTCLPDSLSLPLTVEGGAGQNLCGCPVAAVQDGVLPAVDVNHGTRVAGGAVAQHPIGPHRALQRQYKQYAALDYMLE